MNSEHIYTALIDVLSYRNKLQSDIQSGTEVFKDSLISALSIFSGVNESVFGVQAISDTIILTCNQHNKFPDFIKMIKLAYCAFLREGLLVRGGIAYSKHFQSGKITYSHAIARAYELESNSAIYPRVVVDKNIIEMYSVARGMPTIFGVGLFKKQNGITFIDILDKNNWIDIYTSARSIFESEAGVLSESAFAKHVWLENYIMLSEHAQSTYTSYIERPVSL